ncbi:MAG TPA: YceI family protein [Puia sp.]|jgi:polyisoprenoid-binding protein YceI|nr:YceI family protein [Puia sp.]
MKPNVLLLLLVLLLTSAGDPSRDLYVLSAEHTVTITGTSNLRDWKEDVCQVSGAVEAEVNPDGTISIASIRITMNVLSIKSDMGRVMDNKTYDALKARTYPKILFTLSAPLTLNPVRDCGISIPVKGSLSLAGVCRPVTMEVNTFQITRGELQFEGYQRLKMTDFGVTPPSALFGTMHASPDITIHFKTNFISQTILNNLKN